MSLSGPLLKDFERHQEMERKMQLMQQNLEDQLQNVNQSQVCALENLKQAYEAMLQEVRRPHLWSCRHRHACFVLDSALVQSRSRGGGHFCPFIVICSTFTLQQKAELEQAELNSEKKKKRLMEVTEKEILELCRDNEYTIDVEKEITHHVQFNLRDTERKVRVLGFCVNSCSIPDQLLLGKPPVTIISFHVGLKVSTNQNMKHQIDGYSFKMSKMEKDIQELSKEVEDETNKIDIVTKGKSEGSQTITEKVTLMRMLQCPGVQCFIL